jgi:hypothetical protein
MWRTALIVTVVVVAALVFGIVLTRRLISTWHPERPESSCCATLVPLA